MIDATLGAWDTFVKVYFKKNFFCVCWILTFWDKTCPFAFSKVLLEEKQRVIFHNSELLAQTAEHHKNYSNGKWSHTVLEKFQTTES